MRGTADTLLDAASIGSRLVLPSQAHAAGVTRANRPKFGFGLGLVTAFAPGPTSLS